MKIKTEVVIDADRETVWRIFDEQGQQETLIDHVTERRKPDFIAGTHKSDKGKAVIVNLFDDLPDGTTKWVAYCNYTFTGVSRMLALFSGGAIRQRVEDDVQRFKLLVESLHSSE